LPKEDVEWLIKENAGSLLMEKVVLLAYCYIGLKFEMIGSYSGIAYGFL